MNVLILNCGSSSVKFSLTDTDSGRETLLGNVAGIGQQVTELVYKDDSAAGERRSPLVLRDHGDALRTILELVSGKADIAAIGHRVVHGGEQFREPLVVDRATLDALRPLDELAPLHNPHNRLGIEMALDLWPDVPQVAVFDTAFHHTLPEQAYRYAVPDDWYVRYGIRRYGFHGTSHRYVSGEAARYLGRAPETLKLISLHLGNGASAAAVDGGRCIDTSMGMTPMAGLVMGTRSGDIDPGALLHLLRKGMSVEQLDHELNAHSGLLGLSGAADMRRVNALAEAGEPGAGRARELFAYRVRKYIGAYCAALGHLDALVFTAGIGEHDAGMRLRILDGLGILGLHVDPERNARSHPRTHAIHAANSRAAILVVPTREELEIARQVTGILQPGGAAGPHAGEP